MASSRLEIDRENLAIAEILSALEDHRYLEAAGLVDRLLSDGIRLSRWTNPEILLLEAELERVIVALADLETEQAELEHLVARFEAAHNEALGDRIARVLNLRMLLLEKHLRTKPESRAAYDEARRDFEEFQQDQETQEKAYARTKWELSDEEQKELKRLFRVVSKKCHPDLVAARHHDAAAQMFRELRKAYDEGDLARLRELLAMADAGLFEISSGLGDDEQTKKRLRARIASIREALVRSRNNVQGLKESAAYRTMMENRDLACSFESQAKLLDQEIENLNEALGEAKTANE